LLPDSFPQGLADDLDFGRAGVWSSGGGTNGAEDGGSTGVWYDPLEGDSSLENDPRSIPEL